MIIPFIQARNYTVSGGRSVDLVVVHDMEAPEVPGTARRVAQWFAGSTAPNASAHYCIDDKEIVQCVRDQDVAWHAPGANARGIGLEHAGYARQTSAEWDDPYSSAMLRLSAKLTAALCTRYRIPAVWLTPGDLLAGKRGITSHNNVSKAFRKSDHSDPGPGFPWERYITLVRSNMVQAAGTEVVSEQVVPPTTRRRGRVVDDFIDEIIRPDGGLWRLKEDGGVFNVPATGAFFGSEFERFQKEGRKGFRLFAWRGGYAIMDRRGDVYHHPDPAWKG